MQSVEWIQDWYRRQCNGEWEHGFGVKIDSLDNPGWSVTIDLEGTDLEGVPMDPVSPDATPDDWLRLECKGKQFVGHGDPTKLAIILDAFHDWAIRSLPVSA